MFRFIKWALVALFAYSVVTATPAQQLAMYQGGRALADAIIDACTRDASPCTQAIAAMRSGLASFGFLERRPAASQSSSGDVAPSGPAIDPVGPLHPWSGRADSRLRPGTLVSLQRTWVKLDDRAAIPRN
jgi:hypothetical protein